MALSFNFGFLRILPLEPIEESKQSWVKCLLHTTLLLAGMKSRRSSWSTHNLAKIGSCGNLCRVYFGPLYQWLPVWQPLTEQTIVMPAMTKNEVKLFVVTISFTSFKIGTCIVWLLWRCVASLLQMIELSWRFLHFHNTTKKVSSFWDRKQNFSVSV